MSEGDIVKDFLVESYESRDRGVRPHGQFDCGYEEGHKVNRIDDVAREILLKARGDPSAIHLYAG